MIDFDRMEDYDYPDDDLEYKLQDEGGSFCDECKDHYVVWNARTKEWWCMNPECRAIYLPIEKHIDLEGLHGWTYWIFPRILWREGIIPMTHEPWNYGLQI